MRVGDPHNLLDLFNRFGLQHSRDVPLDRTSAPTISFQSCCVGGYIVFAECLAKLGDSVLHHGESWCRVSISHVDLICPPGSASYLKTILKILSIKVWTSRVAPC